VLDTFYGVLEFATFFFISRAFGNVNESELSGAPNYFAFAAIGIVLSLVVEAASSGLASRVREEQLSGSLEALAAQPLSSVQLCLGFTAFPFVYALARAALYLCIAALLIDVDIGKASWPGLALMFVASGAAMSALGMLVGAAVLVWKRGRTVAGTVLFGMTLLGGSLFPVSALPDWLERLSALVPLRYAYDGVRDALYRGEGWAGDFLALVAFAIVAVPLAIWVFGYAFDAARRAGSLGEY
jgi:ABC-type multidrug transport system permease subunit